MTVKYTCVNESCRKQVAATKNLRYRTHTDGRGNPCELSAMEIPSHVLDNPATDHPADVPQENVDYAVCPQCERKVKLTRLGYFEPHDTTLKGGDRCPVSGVRQKHARPIEDRRLPGDEPASAEPKKRDSEPGEMAKAKAALTTSPVSISASAGADGSSMSEATKANLARDPMKVLPLGSGSEQTEPGSSRSAPSAASSVLTDSSSPGSASTSSASPEPLSEPGSTSSDAPGKPEEPASAGSDPPGPFRVAPAVSERFQQPYSPFSQPGPIPVTVKTADAMNDRGKEIATRLRETFYAYTNRNSSDNRSAQRTLGPSEIGSPCDRQLAMKLMGIQPVNPQEGWAPFVGTAVHAELAKMFEWANGSGSGRYAVEMPLSFGSALVPRGTGDLLDRVMFMFLDHKLMGKYSLKKLVEEGPSDTYRAQIHTYAYGAVLAGEKVKEVAIVAWPREESSLQNLYVHVEPYNKQIALDAIRRVEGIAGEARRLSQPTRPDGQWSAARPLEVAREFPAGDDCKWCPFHLKGDKEMRRGCPGK